MWPYVWAYSVVVCIVVLFVLLWVDYVAYKKEQGENRRISLRLANVKRRRPRP